MLTIRPEQMQILAVYMRKQYVEKVASHLRQHLPDAVAEIEPAALRARIDAGIERAAAYGITGEGETTLFIDLTFGLSNDFDSRRENAWMVPILKRADLDGRDKMNLIYKKLERAAAPK